MLGHSNMIQVSPILETYTGIISLHNFSEEIQYAVLCLETIVDLNGHCKRSQK